jgi:hypothetical protein
VVALVVLAVWVGLAFGSPTTTYHLAPAVLTAAWPVGARWLTGTPPPPGLAAGCAGAGLARAVGALVMLGASGHPAGPALPGISGPIVEGAVAALLSAATGGWISQRGR